VTRKEDYVGGTERQATFDMPLNDNTRNLLPPGDMHEPEPYTGELDWPGDGSGTDTPIS